MELSRVDLATDQLAPGPWVFARQVRPPHDPVEDGALVAVHDASGRFLGHGLYNARSEIRVRWLVRGRKGALDRPREFLLARLRNADRLRRRTLRLEEVCDTYRVVHAEGDDLSGLIVDRLGTTLVCEHHALGFHRLRDAIEDALAELYPGFAIVHRVPPSAARAEGIELPAAAPRASEPVAVHEYGVRYLVRPAQGHKTGWFCDQRENRQRVAGLAAGRTVLDLCCNAGGFALAAASAGARRVVGVDLDERALALARAAGDAAGLAVEWRHEDAFDALRALARAGPRPELVVLDPHKLVPGRRDLEAGLRRYLDLNALALAAVAPGGLLATFSCSGAVDLPTFLGMLFRAARRAERPLRLLEVLGAGPDHPQRPEFGRSRYLKGALVAVD